MKRTYPLIMVIIASIIFVSFFLPWVRIEPGQMGMLKKFFAGKQISRLASVSAFQIPVMANSKDRRLIIKIIEGFNPDIKDADKKSFVLWAIPVVAITCAAASVFFTKGLWAHLVLGIIGFGVFCAGIFKILTADFSRFSVRVTIAEGAWIALSAYLAMGVVALIRFCTAFVTKRAA